MKNTIICFVAAICIIPSDAFADHLCTSFITTVVNADGSITAYNDFSRMQYITLPQSYNDWKCVRSVPSKFADTFIAVGYTCGSKFGEISIRAVCSSIRENSDIQVVELPITKISDPIVSLYVSCNTKRK